MYLYEKRHEWIKCQSCSGTGTLGAIDRQLLPVVNNLNVSKKDRAFLVQGVCTACAGTGQIKLIKKTGMYRLGLFLWLWRQLFK